jgi:hypothetical protein
MRHAAGAGASPTPHLALQCNRARMGGGISDLPPEKQKKRAHDAVTAETMATALN